MKLRQATAVVCLLLAACQPKDNSSVGAPVASVASSASATNAGGGEAKSAGSPRTGTFAIPAMFDGATSFSQGLAAVELGGKWGFIENTGRTAILPQFGLAGKFAANGLAWVVVGGKGWKTEAGFKVVPDGKYGFIDKQGSIVINPQFDNARDFEEGLAAVLLGDYDTGKWAFVDEQGNIVIEPTFSEVGSFLRGVAAVAIGRNEEQRIGLIDHRGNFVVKPELLSVARSIDSDLVSYTLGDKWGVMDTKGRVLIQPQFERLGAFQEGLAPAQFGGKWGYIDTSGKIIINPQFDQALLFSEGRAGVRIQEKWGLMDRSGKMVASPQWSSAPSEFKDGLSAVVVGDMIKNGALGFVQKDGRYVINPQFGPYMNAEFHEGLVPVRVGSGDAVKWGYIYR